MKQYGQPIKLQNIEKVKSMFMTLFSVHSLLQIALGIKFILSHFSNKYCNIKEVGKNKLFPPPVCLFVLLPGKIELKTTSVN